jgi:hypothetical protein
MNKKNGADIKQFFEDTKKRFDPLNFFTNTKFKHIFAFWIIVIILFGGIYFSLSGGEHSITQQNQPLTKDVNGFLNALYFSVISATATGYGDLLPHGFSKGFATLEVILGLTIFGMLISKLVSYKQEIILEEIYEISFDEKINRLRSALYLFRADVVRLMDKIEIEELSKRKFQNLKMLLNTLENTMQDIEKLLCPKTQKDFTMDIDELKLELILNSIDLSFSKIVEILNLMNTKEKDWRTTPILKSLEDIQDLGEHIFNYYKDKKLGSTTISKIKVLNNHLDDMDKAIDRVN